MNSSISSSDTKLDETAETTAGLGSSLPNHSMHEPELDSRQLDAGDLEKRSSRAERLSGDLHLAPTRTHDPDYEVSWDDDDPMNREFLWPILVHTLNVPQLATIPRHEDGCLYLHAQARALLLLVPARSMR